MSDSHGPKRIPTRRQVLQGIGAAATAAPLASLFACSGDGSADGDSGGESAGSTGAAGSSTSGSGAASTSAGSSATTGGGGTAGGSTDGAEGGSTATDGSEGDGTTGACADVDGWATGGTASMCGTYPDPFTRGLGNSCELLCSMTLGPCYAETLERKDVTEGHDGLPVRLAFLVVDESCTPVPDAEIDIWHCSPNGIYSGDDAASNCTFNDAEALASRWFRGVQTTDANGRADFDTCFPGWYSGRTIHIHLTVRVGGVEMVTTQLVFDDGLCDEIVADEPIYSDRGPRDTTNVTDGIVGAAPDIADYTFETEHMSDGAMLAWKALVLRSSTGESLCSIGGGGGGGPPPGG